MGFACRQATVLNHPVSIVHSCKEINREFSQKKNEIQEGVVGLTLIVS